MIIECAHCHARYQYDEARFEGKASKKIRCAKCHEVFEIRNPATAGASTVTPPAPKPAPTPSSPATQTRTPLPPSASATPPAKPIPAPMPPPVQRVTEEALDSTMTRQLKTVDEPLPFEPPPPPPQPVSEDQTPRMPRGKRLSLAIIEGPESGKVYRIEKPKIVIGRAGADLALNDNETSRAHAAIEVRDSVIVLQDLGSTNGTLVEGQKVNGEVELYNQSEFQIGGTTLMLIVTEGE